MQEENKDQNSLSEKLNTKGSENSSKTLLGFETLAGLNTEVLLNCYNKQHQLDEF